MNAAVVLLLLLAAGPASAQDATSGASDADGPAGWQYGGFVDIAYLHDFQHPDNKLFRSRGTAWHVDELHLNMAGAYAKRKASERSRWGAEILLHAGKDDEIFGFSATAPNLGGADVLRHVGLANVSYLAPVGKGLTLQGGIFGSLIGYDSLYAKDNFNYTRPWGADFTPYLMMGVNASYPVTEKLTGAFYVINGYWHLANANRVPTSGLQLAFKANQELTIKQTLLWGPHQTNTSLAFWRFLSDTIVERRNGRLTLAGEYHVSTEQVASTAGLHAWWMAAQLPIRWTIDDTWSLAVRPEIAWDSHGLWTLAEQAIKAVTTTMEYRLPYRLASTLLRAEYRVDDSRGPGGGFFAAGRNGGAAPRLVPTQHLWIVAGIVTFDSPTR